MILSFSDYQHVGQTAFFVGYAEDLQRGFPNRSASVLAHDRSAWRKAA